MPRLGYVDVLSPRVLLVRRLVRPLVRRLPLVLVALRLTSLVAGEVPLGLTPLTLLLYLLRIIC